MLTGIIMDYQIRDIVMLQCGVFYLNATYKQALLWTSRVGT